MLLAVSGGATHHGTGVACVAHGGEALTAVALTTGITAVYAHGALAATLATGTVRALSWWGDGAVLLCIRGDILHRYLRNDEPSGAEALPVEPRISYTQLPPTRLPSPGRALACSSFGVAIALHDSIYILDGPGVYEAQPLEVVKVKCFADTVTSDAVESDAASRSADGRNSPPNAPPTSGIRAIDWSYAGSALCVVLGRARACVVQIDRNDAAVMAAAAAASPKATSAFGYGGFAEEPPPPPPPFTTTTTTLRHPPHLTIEGVQFLYSANGVNALATHTGDGCVRLWAEHRTQKGKAAYYLAHAVHDVAAFAPLYTALPPVRGSVAVNEASMAGVFGLPPGRQVDNAHTERCLQHTLLAVDATGALVRVDITHLGSRPQQAVKAARVKYPMGSAAQGARGGTAPADVTRICSAVQGTHADDVHIIAALDSGDVVAHSVMDGRTFSFTGHHHGVREVAAHPVHPLVATLDTTGEVMVWLDSHAPGYHGSSSAGAQPQLLQIARYSERRLSRIAWSPSALELFGSTRDGGDASVVVLTLHVRDVCDGAGDASRLPLPAFPPAYALSACCLSPPTSTALVTDPAALHRRHRRGRRRAAQQARREKRSAKAAAPVPAPASGKQAAMDKYAHLLAARQQPAAEETCAAPAAGKAAMQAKYAHLLAAKKAAAEGGAGASAEAPTQNDPPQPAVGETDGKAAMKAKYAHLLEAKKAAVGGGEADVGEASGATSSGTTEDPTQAPAAALDGKAAMKAKYAHLLAAKQQQQQQQHQDAEPTGPGGESAEPPAAADAQDGKAAMRAKYAHLLKAEGGDGGPDASLAGPADGGEASGARPAAYELPEDPTEATDAGCPTVAPEPDSSDVSDDTEDEAPGAARGDAATLELKAWSGVDGRCWLVHITDDARADVWGWDGGAEGAAPEPVCRVFLTTLVAGEKSNAAAAAGWGSAAVLTCAVAHDGPALHSIIIHGPHTTPHVRAERVAAPVLHGHEVSGLGASDCHLLACFADGTVRKYTVASALGGGGAGAWLYESASSSNFAETTETEGKRPIDSTGGGVWSETPRSTISHSSSAVGRHGAFDDGDVRVGVFPNGVAAVVGPPPPAHAAGGAPSNPPSMSFAQPRPPPVMRFFKGASLEPMGRVGVSQPGVRGGSGGVPSTFADGFLVAKQGISYDPSPGGEGAAAARDHGRAAMADDNTCAGQTLPPYHPDNIAFLLKTSEAGNSSKAAGILSELGKALGKARTIPHGALWDSKVDSSLSPVGPGEDPAHAARATDMVWDAGVINSRVLCDVHRAKGQHVPHEPLPVDEGEDLAGLLATSTVPGLSRGAVFQLLFLLDVERTRRADGEAFDEAGVHLMHAIRFRKASLKHATKTATGGAGKAGALPWHTVVWGVHSDSTDSILQSTTTLYKDQLSWNDVLDLRLPLWLNSNAQMRAVCEKQANTLFQRKRDPRDAALLYCALGKKAVLVQLFKLVSEPRLSDFFNRDFTQASHQAAASKNALSALSKGNVCFAAAFFILADRAVDAADIILQRMDDWVLAYTVLRLIDDAPLLGPLCRKFLEAHQEKIVGRNPYLQHIIEWKLGRYEQSFGPILSVRSGYSGLYEMACAIIARPQLRVAEGTLFPAAKKCVLLLQLLQTHLERGRVGIAVFCWRVFRKCFETAEEEQKSGGYKAAKKKQEAAAKQQAAIDSGQMDFSAFGMMMPPAPPQATPAVEADATDDAASDDDDADDADAPPRLNELYVAAVRGELCVAVLSLHLDNASSALAAHMAHELARVEGEDAEGGGAASFPVMRDLWRAAVADTTAMFTQMCEETEQDVARVVAVLTRRCAGARNAIALALLDAVEQRDAVDADITPQRLPKVLAELCVDIAAGVGSLALAAEVAPTGARTPASAPAPATLLNHLLALLCCRVYDPAAGAGALMCAAAAQLLAVAWAHRSVALLAAMVECPMDLRDSLETWVRSVVSTKRRLEEASLQQWADARQELAMHGDSDPVVDLSRAQRGHCAMLRALVGLCICTVWRRAFVESRVAVGDNASTTVAATMYTTLAGLGRRCQSYVSGMAQTQGPRGFSVFDAACARRITPRVARLVVKELSVDGKPMAPTLHTVGRAVEDLFTSWQYEMGRLAKPNPALERLVADVAPLPQQAQAQGGNADGATGAPSRQVGGIAAYRAAVFEACAASGTGADVGVNGAGNSEREHTTRRRSIESGGEDAACEEVLKLKKGGIHGFCLFADSQIVVCHQRGIAEASVAAQQSAAFPSVLPVPSAHSTGFPISPRRPLEDDDRSEQKFKSIAGHPTLPLYVAAGGDVVNLYNTGVPTPLVTYRSTRDAALQRVKVSHSGSLVAACDGKGHLFTWRLETGVQTGNTRITASGVYKDTCADVFFVDDATLVGTVGQNRSQPAQLILHDLLFSRKGAHPGVATVALPADMEPTVATALQPSRDILVCGRSGEVCLYDLRNLKQVVYHSRIHERSIRAVGVNPHNGHAALGTSGGDMLYLNPTKGLDPLSTIDNVHPGSKNPFSFDGSNATTQGVTCVAYEDRYWYSAGSDGRVCRRAV